MTAPAATATTPAAGETGIDQRGRTHIPDRVVERVVTVAVDEVEAAVGSRRGVLGVPLGQREHAQVQVSTRGTRVVCRVWVTLAYPVSVRRAAAAIRDRVTDRVETLTGLQVGVVDVAVTGLSTHTRPRIQ